MRWHLMVRAAWRDLFTGRGLRIWLLVTLSWGCLLRIARFEQLILSDAKELIKRTDMVAFVSAWNEYPFTSCSFLIMALTLIYNYQNRVVMREVLAGLTRAEFFLRQYLYLAFLAMSQLLFFFVFYFSTDLLIKLVHGNLQYDFNNTGFAHLVFENFVAHLFYGSLGLFFINYFRSYMLLLAYIILAVIEQLIVYKFEADPGLRPFIVLLPLTTIEQAFSISFAKLTVILGACFWVCMSIAGNSIHWAKRPIL